MLPNLTMKFFDNHIQSLPESPILPFFYPFTSHADRAIGNDVKFCRLLNLLMHTQSNSQVIHFVDLNYNFIPLPQPPLSQKFLLELQAYSFL